MSKEKIKVYLYTRVSTAMQIDGYSLEAQKTKMKAYCDYNEYEIAGEYEDAGKSGKSIEGRIAFNQMMDDIKSGKDRQGVLKVYLKESKKQKCNILKLLNDAAEYRSSESNIKLQWIMMIVTILSLFVALYSIKNGDVINEIKNLIEWIKTLIS